MPANGGGGDGSGTDMGTMRKTKDVDLMKVKEGVGSMGGRTIM